ncbi:hypothetical protein [Clostridium sp. UBA4548]|uniref:hypothetical protein n=1 Tax=Clostridium sp. UBA4548 TaxID=1946361 RepID=UPI0025C40F31|nr:hypothetical protein [Clostridium sp. UBA4548]
MTINSKANRKTEDVEVIKKVLLEILEERHEGYVIHSHYLQDFDQFFVICYVNKNDDDAFATIYYDYEEALNMTCDRTIN